MDFAPAEQVEQALAIQDRAYALFDAAKNEMKKSDRLIKQLTDECGSKFICGGKPYVISHQGSNGKWPHNRPRLDDHKEMPIIDRDAVPAMPGMSGESVMPPTMAGKARFLSDKLKAMNDGKGPKPLTFGKEVLVDDTDQTGVIHDECQTQGPGEGSCY